MEPLRIEIPQHVRRVQMSEKRRIIYFEWNGLSIKARNGAKVPRHFFRDKMEYPIDVTIEHLRANFCITIVNDKGKIVDYIKDDKRLPSPLSMHHKYKYILNQKDPTSQIWTPVIANSKTAGTPSSYLINGQDIYSGVLKDHALSKVMRTIKECFLPYIIKLPVIKEYPIDITCEIHDTIKSFYSNRKSKVGERWDVDNYAYPYLKAFPDLLTVEGKIKDDDRLHIPGTIHTTFHPVEEHSKRKLVFIISKTIRPEIVDNETYKGYHKNSETYESEDLDLVKDEEDHGYGILVTTSKNQQEKLNKAKDLFTNQETKDEEI